MFKNNYQGGAVVEIFCAQGKDPVAKWKLSGGAIHKEYNKEIKGFVYCLEGSSQTVKMQMPRNGKMSLGLLQRFLVFQVIVPHSRDFSIELMITDTAHLKRRLYLSTVHKELSTTLWHAKIPLVGLNHNIWSTLCIDLASFTSKLFKDVGFVSLDGITLFASCSIRRIFTMKAEPDAGDEMFLSGGGVMEWIPRSCLFPQDVKHITQVLNIETLKKADVKTGLLVANSDPEQSAGVAPTRSSSHQKTRPQGVLQSASGSRVLGPQPQSEVKSCTASDGVESSSLCTSNMGSPCCKLNQKSAARNQSYSSQYEKHSQRDCSPSLRKVQCIGTSGILQPHPPNNRVCDKKPRVLSPGQQKLTSSDDDSRKKRNNPKPCTPPCSRQGSRQQPLSLIEETELLTADKRDCSPVKDGPRALRQDECVSLQSGLPCDLQVWSSWESNEEPEPQLNMEDSVFTFSSQPHTPRRSRGPGDLENMETKDYCEVQDRRGRRGGAPPEDDFIGSESDEDEPYSGASQDHRNATDSGLGASRYSDETLDEVLPQSQTSSKGSGDNNMISTSITKAEPAGIVPKRCLSPNNTSLRTPEAAKPSVFVNSSVSLSRRLLQEVRMVNSRGDKDEEEWRALVDSSDRSPHLLHSLQLHQDEDELRMLASLKREQEEDECRAGLSASQIHQCNVSISMSIDDTSTWTHITMPDNQGHHYQKEMNPLLCSNPREWMDVLSPPIMPPGQCRRSGDTWEDLVGEADKCVIEENEEEYLNLLYDPCLNCYFDPKSGKYYELA